MLRDRTGLPFITGVHPLADLAPRDVVAAAITRRLAETGAECVWLDATAIQRFAGRFPTVYGVRVDRRRPGSRSRSPRRRTTPAAVLRPINQPRYRGEYYAAFLQVGIFGGSPPRARGTQGRHRHATGHQGVPPRAREHDEVDYVIVPGVGPSPRARVSTTSGSRWRQWTRDTPRSPGARYR